MRARRTIIFFGPDASGKTTQAGLLVSHLRHQKRKVCHVWIRARHSVAFFLSEFLIRIGYFQNVKVPSGMIYKVVDSNLLRKMRRTWALIEFASVLPWIITRVYLPRLLGKTVVAERYTIDTIVYLDYWLDHDYSRSSWARLLLGFVPKEAILIHFDAETETLTKRLRFDTATQDFIVFQRREYQMFGKMLGAVTVNTTELDTRATFDKIVAAIQ